MLRNGGLGAFLGIAQNLGLGDETVATLASWTAAGETEDEEAAWGSWGLFEAINVEALPDRLFYEAENWLFEHAAGLVGIRGPMSIEPLVPPGLLTDGFDAYPAVFVPHNPPYYPEMIEGQGFETGRHLACLQPRFTFLAAFPIPRGHAAACYRRDLARGFARLRGSRDDWPVGVCSSQDSCRGLIISPASSGFRSTAGGSAQLGGRFAALLFQHGRARVKSPRYVSAYRIWDAPYA